jgi:hypothetical protein
MLMSIASALIWQSYGYKSKPLLVPSMRICYLQQFTVPILKIFSTIKHVHTYMVHVHSDIFCNTVLYLRKYVHLEPNHVCKTEVLKEEYED